MKFIKQITSIVALIFCINSNSQTIQTGYNMYDLGKTSISAKAAYCSTNLINGNLRTSALNVRSTSSNPLQTGKVYKINDDGWIFYGYIIEKRASPHGDRDTYSMDMIQEINFDCNSDVIEIKDFKVNEISSFTYTGTPRKFNYEFKIKGTYSIIELRVYKNSVSANNLLGFINWNRDRDDDLVFPDYTVHSTWFSSYKNFSVNAGQVYILEAKYGNNTKTLTYSVPTPTGNPDLVVDEFGSSINSDCYTCSSNIDFHNQYDGSKKYLLSNQINATITILNDGTTNAVGSKVKVYLSKDDVLSVEDSQSSEYDYRLETSNIGSLNVSGYTNFSFNVNRNDIGNLRKDNGYSGYQNIDYNSTSSNGVYYILIDVDSEDVVNEDTQGELNNLYVIPFQYNSNPSTSYKEIDEEVVMDNTLNNKKYLIDVYNYLGQKIISKEVYTDNEVLEVLSKGIYIFVSKDGARKVLKE